MLLWCAILSLFIIKAEGGEFLIAKSPASVKFQGDDTIDQSLISEVCSAAMGFTTHKESDWNGMTITNPFNFAKAVVVLYVDGISTLGRSSKLQKYPLINDEDEYITWKKIKSKISDRYPMENNTMLKVELGKSGNFEEIKFRYLDRNLNEDLDFLNELSDLNKYMKDIKKSNGIPDLYWFNLKSLHQISDLKGTDDPSTIEAKEKVHDALLKLGKVYNDAYDDKALVFGLISDASHTRRIRSLTDEKQKPFNASELLKNNMCDPDFPVIFNIILWFTVALICTLLAVSVFIASMDPGRDSIIYRMTSNRMKKDS